MRFADRAVLVAVLPNQRFVALVLHPGERDPPASPERRTRSSRRHMHADEKPSLGLDVWKWQILLKTIFGIARRKIDSPTAPVT